MTTITLDPTQSQEIYEYVINERSKLPATYDYADALLTKENLLQIYDIVAINRAKTRGTQLSLDVNDDGQVTTIEYEAVKIPPEEIVIPKRKNCSGCGKEFENALAKCPKCGKENQR